MFSNRILVFVSYYAIFRTISFVIIIIHILNSFPFFFYLRHTLCDVRKCLLLKKLIKIVGWEIGH